MSEGSKPRGKFRDVADAMRGRITAGEWRTGDLVPSEATLGTEFGIARGTVRAALAELEAARLIRVVPGKGRVVHDPQNETRALSAEELLEQLKERVRSDAFVAGAAFLSESDIVQEYGVTRHAARRALGALEAGGILTSAQGRRRTVAEEITAQDER